MPVPTYIAANNIWIFIIKANTFRYYIAFIIKPSKF